MQVYVVSREEEWVNKLKNEIVAIFSDLEKAKTFCQEMALEISHNVIVSDEPERSHEVRVLPPQPSYFKRLI